MPPAPPPIRTDGWNLSYRCFAHSSSLGLLVPFQSPSVQTRLCMVVPAERSLHGFIATTCSHYLLQRTVTASVCPATVFQGRPAGSRHTASSGRLEHPMGLSLSKVALWSPACVCQGLAGNLDPCPVQHPLAPYNFILFPLGSPLPKLRQASLSLSINWASFLFPSCGYLETP